MWYPITEVREAHLRAVFAESAARWHVAARDYLYCLEAAQSAQDERAVRFFAAKLVVAYEAMALPHKAARYLELATLPQGC